MAMSLQDLVEAGRIRDEAALKRAYRKLAKRLHPDLSGGDGGNHEARNSEAFIALRAEYERARAALVAPRPDPAPKPVFSPARNAPDPAARAEKPLRPLPYSRKGFYETFQELLARGFPRLPGRRWPNGAREGYEEARWRFLGLLAGRDQVEPSRHSLEAFLDFEAGYLTLALADPAGLSAEVRLAHGLRNLLLDIAGYHDIGTIQALRYATNEWPRLREELLARTEKRPFAFLGILMADLEDGPASA